MGQSILVVEDDTFLTNAYLHQLGSEGYTIDTAKDGEEAITKLEKAHPALVVLDLIMPKKGGLEVLKWMRSTKEHEKTPVIVATNVSSPVDKAACEQLHATYTIKTDVSVQQFTQLVQKMLPKS